MKKILFLVICFFCFFSLSSCNSKKTQKATSFTDLTSKTDVENIEVTDYVTIDDVIYAKFYLGEIDKVFVSALTTPIKNTGGLTLKYSYSNMTSSSIESTIRSYISQTKTISTSHSVDVGVTASVPILGGVFNLGGNVSYNYTHLTEDTRTTINESTRKEFNSIAEEYAGEIEVDLDKYERDLYYTYGLFAKAKVYQTIEYDTKTERSKSYAMTEFQDQYIELTSSKNGFILPDDFKLNGIKSVDKSYLNNLENKNKISSIIFNNIILNNKIKVHSGNTVKKEIKIGQGLTNLQKYGFKKIKLNVSMYIAEVDDGKQYVSISSPKGELLLREYNHGGSGAKKEELRYTIEEIYDISNPLLDDTLYFEFSSIKALFKDWYISNVQVEIRGIF